MRDDKPHLAIIYGWAEGPWHAKRLIKAAESNFTITEHLEEADIVLAHSAGCYLVPENTTAKLVVLIGIPYWPGKSLVVRITKKVVSDLKAHHQEGEVRFWVAKTFHNIWYIFKSFPHSIKMLRAYLKHTFYNGSASVLVLCNQQDPFCDPVGTESITYDKKWSFASVPGVHDECWLKPGLYIQILKDNYARVLAETES